MTNLIGQVRDFTIAGTADYTLGTVNYWTDDQIQKVLDRNKLNVYHEQLVGMATYSTAGSLQWKEFYSGYGNYEETSGGTAVFVIEDGTGNAIGTSEWSVDYANGKVTFGGDQGGSIRYLTGTSYDINRAASDIWKQKAGHHAGAVNFKTDNMSINRSDLLKQDMEMATYYANQGRVRKISTERDDTN